VGGGENYNELRTERITVHLAAIELYARRGVFASQPLAEFVREHCDFLRQWMAAIENNTYFAL
jgi:hypothetical protein